MRRLVLIAGLLAALFAATPVVAGETVRIKDLGSFQGWRSNPLVGVGVVTGLAGSGDSPRNQISRQATANVLGRLGLNIPSAEVQSRNVAAVTVTATLPPSANVGERIDVTVSSIGDARSLVGGTLLMTVLQGPDQRPYALAQGPVVVGGYRFDSNQNLQQRNFPASGMVVRGATIEAAAEAELLRADGVLTFLLKDADFTTAVRIADGINDAVGADVARPEGADAVSIRATGADLYRMIARIENVSISPDISAKVVINERTGTVVAGGGVRISEVVVSQGDIKVSVTIDNQASQPAAYSLSGQGVRSLVVTNTRLDVSGQDAVARFPNTTVADLVEGLSRVNVNTRGVIAVLQALQAAGALHAEIVVQ